MREINTAKNKSWVQMTREERIAFVEAVCMKANDFMKSCYHSRNTRHFFKFWGDEILKSEPSTSSYMDNYFYNVKQGAANLCIQTSDGLLIDVSNDVREVRIFVHNAVNEIPTRSPVMDKVLSGKKKFEIISEAMSENEYKHLQETRGRKPQKDSLRQRILRGEITRYEAYDKPKRELTKQKES